MTHLTKQSSEADIKTYFAGILTLSRSNEEFPVNLNDVWALAYATKSKAMQSLRNNDLFMQDVDYQVLYQKVENLKGGRPTCIYMLSVQCLEFLIARKVRPVFEVYRQVFHKVANGEYTQTRMGGEGKSLEETLAPLAHYHSMIMKRWQNVLGSGDEHADKVHEECDKHYCDYRADINNLVYAETVARIEGGCEDRESGADGHS